MNNIAQDNRFADLGNPNRIWVISSIHGDIERLTALHDKLLPLVEPGDRIIYSGNYTGYSKDAVICIDEILAFRRMMLSQPAMMPQDIIYLRGGQEEMWQKLLQLQFAPNPSDVLLWMLGNGLSDSLYAYGISPHDGIEACRAGVMGLTKWTNSIREAVRGHAGHDTFGMNLFRAAYTDQSAPYPMLLVNAGIDTYKPITEQKDTFWWAGESFDSIQTPYAPFQKVIRGFDPSHKGVKMNCITASIDGGCGFGGELICAGFDKQGDNLELLSA